MQKVCSGAPSVQIVPHRGQRLPHARRACVGGASARVSLCLSPCLSGRLLACLVVCLLVLASRLSSYHALTLPGLSCLSACRVCSRARSPTSTPSSLRKTKLNYFRRLGSAVLVLNGPFNVAGGFDFLCSPCAPLFNIEGAAVGKAHFNLVLRRLVRKHRRRVASAPNIPPTAPTKAGPTHKCCVGFETPEGRRAHRQP